MCRSSLEAVVGGLVFVFVIVIVIVIVFVFVFVFVFFIVQKSKEEELGVDVCRSSLEAVVGGLVDRACASSEPVCASGFEHQSQSLWLEQTVSRGRPPETLAWKKSLETEIPNSRVSAKVTRF